MTALLDSEEAARRLGVKVSTLYAYVSRGLLTPEREVGGRRSLYALDDVERLARRSRPGRADGPRLASVVTSVTHLGEDGPAYRGVPATGLATTATFEDVAEALWASGPESWDPVTLGAAPPGGLAVADRLSWVAVMAGASDPLRSDLRPEAVARAAARLIATLVDAVPPPAAGARLVLDGGPAPSGSIAQRLAGRLSGTASGDLTRAVNAALVLLADHELATSTVAVRLAASTRADLYAAVLAGLATISGPLHGAASSLAHALLVRAEADGVERALDETLRWQGLLPGFGQALYEDGDPRATVLLRCAGPLGTPARRDLVAAVVDLARRQGLPPPNVDLGLAAVTYTAGLAPDAGRTLFTLARVAGWAAHFTEELGEPPLRFRARAAYSSGTGRPR
ncbi:MAG TPA: citrate/2-methylcitrate synthase [Acidimicrobiales bacterium]|nr:citrate/2-methylcitrate synthase [Acidimicrobiales bacterium]